MRKPTAPSEPFPFTSHRTLAEAWRYQLRAAAQWQGELARRPMKPGPIARRRPPAKADPEAVFAEAIARSGGRFE